MKNRYVIVISLLFLSNFSYSSEDITIYHAKEVVTLDEKVASANAVSVKSDRVMAIGSLDDLIERNPDASINRQFQNDVIVPFIKKIRRNVSANVVLVNKCENVSYRLM